jgi:beta-fructofuranosidase
VLTIEGSWVWDFWLADDGHQFHAFFLHAPTALGEEIRRHRAARIGHAVSSDLVSWTVLEQGPFGPGAEGSFDETATWTGSVVRGDDGLWRMFYTGSRFLADEPAMANIESIGVAISADLHTWEKQLGPIASADPRWYETWGTSDWKEEAWRDPWVFRDPRGDGWHMLVTARSLEGALDDRGVIGHAVSTDLATWEVRPPLSRPGAGFAHLEVPQIEEVDGRWLLLFSSTEDSMTSPHIQAHPGAGTWALTVQDPTRCIDIADARPLTDASLYSGRAIRDRDGRWQFLAFRNSGDTGAFVGGIADPIPLDVLDGRAVLRTGVSTA